MSENDENDGCNDFLIVTLLVILSLWFLFGFALLKANYDTKLFLCFGFCTLIISIFILSKISGKNEEINSRKKKLEKNMKDLGLLKEKLDNATRERESLKSSNSS